MANAAEHGSSAVRTLCLRRTVAHTRTAAVDFDATPHWRDLQLRRISALLAAGRGEDAIERFFGPGQRGAAFTAHSRAGDPGLSAVLQRTAAPLLGRGAKPRAQRFLRYRSLWHGSCFLGDSFAIALYHSTTDAGVLSVPFAGRRHCLGFTKLGWSLGSAPLVEPE
ncbi:hypothetical protein [Haliangium ochraceum]|uniref:Uncharacterized protein n=1 Tax=Haliangium ochraceum (strain DSM 14365 / JCM 11303 / SMP-2) TaxID=502025 RepID=D0LY07_HALO1|nr:hypothetical protein [Haliangium ochraceum]ACY14362.1 hypothetical protein Hoch_1814 [Haliangium ochraceum DSM 14365]